MFDLKLFNEAAAINRKVRKSLADWEEQGCDITYIDRDPDCDYSDERPFVIFFQYENQRWYVYCVRDCGFFFLTPQDLGNHVVASERFVGCVKELIRTTFGWDLELNPD